MFPVCIGRPSSQVIRNLAPPDDTTSKIPCSGPNNETGLPTRTTSWSFIMGPPEVSSLRADAARYPQGHTLSREIRVQLAVEKTAAGIDAGTKGYPGRVSSRPNSYERSGLLARDSPLGRSV